MVCLIALGLYCGLAIPVSLNIGDNYGGSLIFYSEDDYTKFKQELINSNAKWDPGEISVLSSEPPIIVEFTDITIPKDYDFPYGKKWNPSYALVGLFTLLLLVIIIMPYNIIAATDGWKWLFKKK